jgi:nucleoside-diphosphate-sugar epimerase
MVLQSDPSRTADLRWKAKVSLEEGLRSTSEWLRVHLDQFPVDYAI